MFYERLTDLDNANILKYKKQHYKRKIHKKKPLPKSLQEINLKTKNPSDLYKLFPPTLS